MALRRAAAPETGAAAVTAGAAPKDEAGVGAPKEGMDGPPKDGAVGAPKDGAVVTCEPKDGGACWLATGALPKAWGAACEGVGLEALPKAKPVLVGGGAVVPFAAGVNVGLESD